MEPFTTVSALCLRVRFIRLYEGIDLPELERIEMGGDALTFKSEDAATTLIMRSDNMNGS